MYYNTCTNFSTSHIIYTWENIILNVSVSIYVEQNILIAIKVTPPLLPLPPSSTSCCETSSLRVYSSAINVHLISRGRGEERSRKRTMGRKNATWRKMRAEETGDEEDAQEYDEAESSKKYVRPNMFVYYFHQEFFFSFVFICNVRQHKRNFALYWLTTLPHENEVPSISQIIFIMLFSLTNTCALPFYSVSAIQIVRLPLTSYSSIPCEFALTFYSFRVYETYLILCLVLFRIICDMLQFYSGICMLSTGNKVGSTCHGIDCHPQKCSLKKLADVMTEIIYEKVLFCEENLEIFDFFLYVW